MLRHFYLSISLIIMAGCGPGVSDYSERVGNTKLRYFDTGGFDRHIAHLDSERGDRSVVEPTILLYHTEDDYVFGARQIIYHYLCNGTRSDVEITDRLDFFVIKVPAVGHEYQVLNFGDFLSFKSYLTKLKVKPKTIDRLKVDKLKEMMFNKKPLGECINPKKLGG